MSGDKKRRNQQPNRCAQQDELENIGRLSRWWMKKPWFSKTSESSASASNRRGHSQSRQWPGRGHRSQRPRWRDQLLGNGLLLDVSEHRSSSNAHAIAGFGPALHSPVAKWTAPQWAHSQKTAGKDDGRRWRRATDQEASGKRSPSRSLPLMRSEDWGNRLRPNCWRTAGEKARGNRPDRHRPITTCYFRLTWTRKVHRNATPDGHIVRGIQQASRGTEDTDVSLSHSYGSLLPAIGDDSLISSIPS